MLPTTREGTYYFVTECIMDSNFENISSRVESYYGPGVSNDSNEPRKKWQPLGYNFGPRKGYESWVKSRHAGQTAWAGVRAPMEWKWDYAEAPEGTIYVSSGSGAGDLRGCLWHAKDINPKSYRVVIGVRDVWGGIYVGKEGKSDFGSNDKAATEGKGWFEIGEQPWELDVLGN